MGLVCTPILATLATHTYRETSSVATTTPGGSSIVVSTFYILFQVLVSAPCQIQLQQLNVTIPGAAPLTGPWWTTITHAALIPSRTTPQAAPSLPSPMLSN